MAERSSAGLKWGEEKKAKEARNQWRRERIEPGNTQLSISNVLTAKMMPPSQA